MSGILELFWFFVSVMAVLRVTRTLILSMGAAILKIPFMTFWKAASFANLHLQSPGRNQPTRTAAGAAAPRAAIASSCLIWPGLRLVGTGAGPAVLGESGAAAAAPALSRTVPAVMTGTSPPANARRALPRRACITEPPITDRHEPPSPRVPVRWEHPERSSTV